MRVDPWNGFAPSLIEALHIDLQTSWFYRHRFNDLDDTVRGLKVTRLRSRRFA
jgi:hypothetical protein